MEKVKTFIRDIVCSVSYIINGYCKNSILHRFSISILLMLLGGMPLLLGTEDTLVLIILNTLILLVGFGCLYGTLFKDFNSKFNMLIEYFIFIISITNLILTFLHLNTSTDSLALGLFIFITYTIMLNTSRNEKNAAKDGNDPRKNDR